jgi:digeranylgeranylglycerophospholipid reductase
MVILNPRLCNYCGGCVSVCPVEALLLEETRLIISEACLDCGYCVTACPMGALQLDAHTLSQEEFPVQQSYDLVIVGAGPGGSTAAKVAAESGLSVLLLEKRQEIGSPVRCAEGVAHNRLIPFIVPDPHWIATEVNQAEIIAISNDDRYTIHGTDGRGYILERRVFDRVLAEKAIIAGARALVKTSATDLVMEGSRVRGVRIQGELFNGLMQLDIEAKIVIASDGVEAQVGRWAGLDLQLPLEDTMVCVQYLLAGIDIDPTCTTYVIGHDIAPGGYAWIFPKGEGVANVGLGVQADLWEKHDAYRLHLGLILPGEGTVLGYLTRFIESDKRLSQGSPVTLISGNVPVSLPPQRIVTDGLMVVGDAARQVDPLTGGGIINAMMAGKLAAEVAVEAIAAGDVSAQFLKKYQDQWDQSQGRKLQRNYRLRRKFKPQERVDSRFARAFAIAVGA